MSRIVILKFLFVVITLDDKILSKSFIFPYSERFFTQLVNTKYDVDAYGYIFLFRVRPLVDRKTQVKTSFLSI